MEQRKAVAAPSPEELRREFLLDPEVAPLNHGSFGACPRLVFERYQAGRICCGCPSRVTRAATRSTGC